MKLFISILSFITNKRKQHERWTPGTSQATEHDEVSKSSAENTHTNITDNDISETKTKPLLLLPRRSQRITKPSQWMRDGVFVVNMVCRTMFNSVLDKK